VVNPASEKQIRQHERGVEVPDSSPKERLADEQQQTDDVVIDEQQRGRTAWSTVSAARITGIVMLTL